MSDEQDAEVREALRMLRDGDEDAGLSHVLTLAVHASDYAIPIVPPAVVDAVAFKYETERDLANGGMDQVAWNHGLAAARAYAKTLHTVGALENAELLDRLGDALAAYEGEHAREAIAADPVTHFLAYRQRVNGPAFGIPEPDEELAEVLLEYVLEHASELPDPDGPLPRAAQ